MKNVCKFVVKQEVFHGRKFEQFSARAKDSVGLNSIYGLFKHVF